MKKLIGILVCMLFFISALPTIDSSIVKTNDVDISITTGRVGLDIGFDSGFDVGFGDGDGGTEWAVKENVL